MKSLLWRMSGPEGEGMDLYQVFQSSYNKITRSSTFEDSWGESSDYGNISNTYYHSGDAWSPNTSFSSCSYTNASYQAQPFSPCRPPETLQSLQPCSSSNPSALASLQPLQPQRPLQTFSPANLQPCGPTALQASSPACLQPCWPRIV